MLVRRIIALFTAAFITAAIFTSCKKTNSADDGRSGAAPTATPFVPQGFLPQADPEAEYTGEYVLVPHYYSIPEDMYPVTSVTLIGDTVYFFVLRASDSEWLSYIPEFWAMDADGTNLRQLNSFFMPDIPEELKAEPGAYTYGAWVPEAIVPLDDGTAYINLSGEFGSKSSRGGASIFRVEVRRVKLATGETIENITMPYGSDDERISNFHTLGSREFAYIYTKYDERGNDVMREARIQNIVSAEIPVKIDIMSIAGIYVNAVVPLQNEELAVEAVNQDGSGAQLLKIDRENGKLGDVVAKISNESQYNTFVCDPEGNIFVSEHTGVFKLALGDPEAAAEMFLSFEILDMPYGPEFLGYASGGRAVFYAPDDEDRSMDLIVLIPTRADEVKPRKVITIASLFDDYNLDKTILAFNKSSTEYRVTLKAYADYSELTEYNNQAKYDAWIDEAVLRLGNDLLFGEAPDMALLHDYIPFDSYAAKGIFEDILPYLSQDNMQLMKCAVNAAKTGDKLYRIGSTFRVETLAVNGDILQNGGFNVNDIRNHGWSFSDFMSLLGANPGKYLYQPQVARENIMNDMVRFSINKYVNRATGAVSFDNPEFIAMLDWLRGFPAIDYEKGGATTTNEMQMLLDILNGTAIGEPASLAGFQEIMFLNGLFSNLVYAGYPGELGSGSALTQQTPLSIISKSDNKEGAWEFIKFMISVPQTKSDGAPLGEVYGFPVLESEFKRLAAYYMRPVTDAKKITGYIYYKTGGMGYGPGSIPPERFADYSVLPAMRIEFEDSSIFADIPPLSQAQVDGFIAFANTITLTSGWEETVWSIVEEELAPFFAGQKTAADTARVINSRVKIYVSEKM